MSAVRVNCIYCVVSECRARQWDNNTRSSAVAVIADRTAYDVRYSYRSLSGIAVVSMSSYLFAVSNGSLFLVPVTDSFFL